MGPKKFRLMWLCMHAPRETSACARPCSVRRFFVASFLVSLTKMSSYESRLLFALRLGLMPSEFDGCGTSAAMLVRGMALGVVLYLCGMQCCHFLSHIHFHSLTAECVLHEKHLCLLHSTTSVRAEATSTSCKKARRDVDPNSMQAPHCVYGSPH